MPRAFLVRSRRFVHELTPPPSVQDVHHYQTSLASLIFPSKMIIQQEVQDEPEDLSLSSSKKNDLQDEPQDLSLPSSRRASQDSASNAITKVSLETTFRGHCPGKGVMTSPLVLYSPATIASFPHSLMSPPTSHGSPSDLSSLSPQESSSSETFDHSCPDCGKRYSTSSNLARHRQTHRSVLDKKARKCPHCDKVYVSMPAYSMHVRTHSQGCQCKFCGKCFSRPWLLQGHIRTHTGEKPFQCNICTKAFADKSNLRAHVQTHSTTKPYSCERCGKAFALKSYLYKHEESSCMRLNKRPNHQRRSNSTNITHLTTEESMDTSSSSIDSSSPRLSPRSPSTQSNDDALTPSITHPRKACLLQYNASLMQLQSLS